MKPSRLLTFGGGDVTPSRPGGWTRPIAVGYFGHEEDEEDAQHG